MSGFEDQFYGEQAYADGLESRLEAAEAARDEALADLAAAREAIASAMTSLATGPGKDGYAYSVLAEVLPEDGKG